MGVFEKTDEKSREEKHDCKENTDSYGSYAGGAYNSPEMGADRKRPVVLICPGGGYGFLSDREAEPVALRMCGMGFHACVLRYSIAPETFPTALWELAASVAWLREHAWSAVFPPEPIWQEASACSGTGNFCRS